MVAKDFQGSIHESVHEKQVFAWAPKMIFLCRAPVNLAQQRITILSAPETSPV